MHSYSLKQVPQGPQLLNKVGAGLQCTFCVKGASTVQGFAQPHQVCREGGGARSGARRAGRVEMRTVWRRDAEGCGGRVGSPEGEA